MEMIVPAVRNIARSSARLDAGHGTLPLARAAATQIADATGVEVRTVDAGPKQPERVLRGVGDGRWY